MTSEPMNRNDADRFDAAVRTHHAAALTHLSPRVQAQLAQRRNAALRGERPATHAPHRLRFAAAGFATLCALAVGLRLYPQSPETAPAVALETATASARYASGSTPLEEDPDFYAWLGSSDAPLLAME